MPIPVPIAFHSFDGWKVSLSGDHRVHGPEGFYTRPVRLNAATTVVVFQ